MVMKPVFCLALLGLAFGIASTSAVIAWPLQDATAASDSVAPRAERPAPDPQRQLARLTKKLQLDDAQRAKIEPILQRRAQQLQQLRTDSSLSPNDRHRRQRELMQDSNDQLLGVLNDTQKQQYQQMKQQVKQRRQDMKSMPAQSSSAQ
jgi:hypothetical protein